MHRNFKTTLLLLAAGMLISSCNTSSTETMNEIQPPIAEKVPHEVTLHGNTHIDNYHWMRLTDTQINAEVKDEQTQKVLTFLNAENDYLKARLKHTEPLQEKIYNEIIGRIKQTDESVPYRENGYWYYTRYEAGQEYPIYCRKKGDMKAAEEILLNINEMAEGHEYYSVTGLSVSEDNSILAYQVDLVSRRRYTIHFKDLKTGKEIGSAIPNTEPGVTWANDNKTIFYTAKDSVTLLSNRIYRHMLGSDPAKDELVYQEKDPSYYMGIYKSRSNKYLLINCKSTLTDQYFILDANKPEGKFTAFSAREKNIKYTIDHHQNKFFIVTNHEALNFRLMETPENNTSRENWKERIAHRKDTLIDGIEVFKNYLVLTERAQASLHIRVMEHATGKDHYLNFKETAYTLYPSINREFDTDLLRYGYTSLATPNSIYDYNMKTGAHTLLKQQEVVGGYTPENYQTERLWAEAKDGTKIPMSIVYKKGIKKDGNNPTLLYGYGSYGSSEDPEFSSSRLSLLDRGFVYAIAHIRGGQEMGRQWYEDGKMFKKKNTFTDFIACAEFLATENFTNPDKLFADGRSAGGLLMGAVATMRPDLFKGIIAGVPFVDVINTMMDETIPLTTNEFDEWGNPKSLESYLYILEYSPYDQVKPQNYPNMLVFTGLHDSQVQYWEPAKWVAKLREMKTDNNLLVLRTNMETGHGSTTGRFKRYRETAQEYAFMLDLVGIKE